MKSKYNKLLDMKYLMLHLKSFLFIGYNSCINNVSTEVLYKWLLWLLHSVFLPASVCQHMLCYNQLPKQY